MNMSSQKVEEYVTALNLMCSLYGLRLGDNENVDGLDEDKFHLVDTDGNRITEVEIVYNRESVCFNWRWVR